jgi:8-oxo-dGTP pyrophosphatase MutT (NUDIX family)
VRPLARVSTIMTRLRWRVTQPITAGVRLILWEEHTLLLVKHTYQRHGYLPGGGLRKGETIEEAARREAAEELGAKLGPLCLLGVYIDFYEHKNDHVFVSCCDDFTLTGNSDSEIECFDFFRLDDLPRDTSSGSMRRTQEVVSQRGLPVVAVW